MCLTRGLVAQLVWTGLVFPLVQIGKGRAPILKHNKKPHGPVETPIPSRPVAPGGGEGLYIIIFVGHLLRQNQWSPPLPSRPLPKARALPNSAPKDANAIDFWVSALQNARALSNSGSKHANAIDFWVSALQNAKKLPYAASKDVRAIDFCVSALRNERALPHSAPKDANAIDF
jgi:hypothetical protein